MIDFDLILSPPCEKENSKFKQAFPRFVIDLLSRI